ncbi:Ig-like domain-containing protein [Rhodococcus sp. UNC363MFTsu5.1]|uniref:Ig-like domain-containing protein n=1 Tax=Rhodococcus sp. UNC363MFTsu5.1 TaxID=1449069 RepID=UPI00048191D7|nr:Ig-like domain-containing protein [Rhodococcus sp. UNC363MFTsu5.1]
MAHRASTRTVAATALAVGALTLLGGGVAGTANAAPSAPATVQTAANVASKITLDPVTGATVGKQLTLKAKVTPAAAGGEVLFKDETGNWNPVAVGADGTASVVVTPEAAGKWTITAIFSGRTGVDGSTTTQEIKVAPEGGAGSADSILEKLRSVLGFGS